MENICSLFESLSINDVLSHYNLTELRTVPPIGPKLDNIKHVVLTCIEDFEKIPKSKGGVYFIVTNESVNHTFHRHSLPQVLEDGFDIIYNGTAQDLRDRAKKHLLRMVSKGMSGISVDILMDEDVESHTKCCYAPNNKKKTPYIATKAIKCIDDVKKLALSEVERSFITSNTNSTIYFRNGINAFDSKHLPYTFKFYFQEIDSHCVRDIIETTWRKKNGVPKLCTYTEGR